LYSHDTVGLGHVRRNLLIAETLAASAGSAAILLVAGGHEAGAFEMPAGVDCLTLPSLKKSSDGEYEPRCLNVATDELVSIRANMIRAAVDAFEPHVLVVDKVPRGALRELEATLQSLRSRGRTHCVLGLRDVLDEPAALEWEWREARNEQAIRDYYDAVWVYGDPAVYDLACECGFSAAVRGKLHYTGYLDPRARLSFSETSAEETIAALGLPPGKLVVCQVGGGEDGAALAETFAQTPLPPDTNGLILTGPFMPRDARQRIRAAVESSRTRVFEFVPEPSTFLRAADRVVAMGGYNTVCELISLRKHALVVPRVTPRREQWIRANRMRELGLLDVLHPNDAGPQSLADWLRREHSPPRDLDRIDFGGLTRLPGLLKSLLETPVRRGPHRAPSRWPSDPHLELANSGLRLR
jgi:predicted glycosyltransferase